MVRIVKDVEERMWNNVSDRRIVDMLDGAKIPTGRKM